MDLKKISTIFVALLFIGLILNYFNFLLPVDQILGVYLWLGVLIAGSFIGAYLLEMSGQNSLIPFSMPLGLLVASWFGWLLYHLVPFNIFPFLMACLGIYAITKLSSKTLVKVIVYNGCFLVIFWLFLVLNSYHPEIYWGEKPMDFNLINFMGRNASFPPEDPWLSGERMKYYYFGYFMFGKLGSFMGLSGETTYHLALGSTAGFFFLAGVAFMRSLGHRFMTSLKGSAALLFATSLGGWFGYLLEGKKGTIAFWASTRVFKNSGFSEYPFWSFIFGDLHPHVMAFPFTLFVMILVIKFIRDEKGKLLSLNTFILGFVWAALGALNAWDLIFVSFFFVLFSLFSGFKKIKELVINPIVPAALLLGGLCWSPMALSLIGGKSAALKIYSGEYNNIFNYFQHQGLWWTFIFLLVVFIKYEGLKIKGFIKAMFGSFLTLLLFTETVVFIDRMNTIFKFGNQLFILLGLIALSLYRDEKRFNYLLTLFLVIFLGSSAYDQLNATKYNAFGTARPTLRGTDYMKKVASGDNAIIQYINENVEGTPVILEAPGKSFENNRARISMHTGLPTYLGWEGHVIIRGGNPRETLKRKKEISALYQSKDALKSYEWLKKRGIQYVVIGGAEHAQYKRAGIAKFEQFIDLFVPVVQTKIGIKTFGLYKVGNEHE